jgi:hypothetical protein
MGDDMGIVTTIIDALRKFGSPTERTAIQRQDEQLEGKRVIARRRRVSRSELGQSTSFVATAEPEPETVVALGDSELAPLLENAALVGDFLVAFSCNDADGHLLDRLDNAFAAWIEASEKKGYSSDAVVEIVGAAFGAFCAATLNMRWIRVTDADGTAIAIQGREKDFRCFPFHVIAKRVPLGEHGFFKPVYISLQDAAERDWKPTNEA